MKLPEVKLGRVRRAVRSLQRGGTASLISVLDRQLAETMTACYLARSVAAGDADPGEAHGRMAEIEHRGDELRGELVAKLAGVLVAPIDREDLFRLSRSVDDVLDNLRDFVRECDLYKAEADEGFLGLFDATAQGVDDLRRAVRTIADDPKETGSCALMCKKSANEIRRQYDVELAALFSGELTMEVIKIRELLRRLDVVGLRLNEAADVLADAAVKRLA